MPSTALAYLQLIAGALLLSTGSVAIKATALDAPALAGWRALVIVAFLLLAVRPARRCYDRSLLPAALATASSSARLLLCISSRRLDSPASCTRARNVSRLSRSSEMTTLDPNRSE